MSPSRPHPDDLATARELIARLCDDRLDAAGMRALETLVCDNADVRRLYILTVSVHADLYLQSAFLSRSAPPDGDEPGEDAPSLHDLVITDAIRDVDVPQPQRPVGPRLAGRRIEPGPTPWHRVRWAAAAAVIIGGATATGAWWMGRPGRSPVAVVPAPSPVVAPPSPRLPTTKPAEELARLDLSLAPVWSGTTPTGRGLTAGDALHLKSGLARLAMRGGTAVVLEGPLDAVLDADHRLRLTRGRLTARSSHQTTGFAVVTPTAVVTDLGTEFGVSASEGAAGHTDVVVLDGVVRVDSAGAATAGPTLHASQACSASKDGVRVSTKPAGAPFVRDADFEHRKSAMLAAAAVYRRPDLLVNWPGDPDLDRVGVLQGGPIGVQWRAAPAAAASKTHGEYAAFLDLDGSTSSRLSLHGYVGLDGSIGVAGKTLYLSWQSAAERTSGGYGGLSLADGDQSVADEQLFVGQAAGSPAFSCQVRSAPHAPVIQLDGDTDKPGTQPLAVDRKTHAWVLRIDFGATASRIAVYLDPPHGTEPATANAVVNADRFRFDRLRLVWGPHDYWVLKRVLMGSSFASVSPG